MTAVEWSEVIRNWAIVLGGAIGFGIAIWRALVADRTARTQERQAEMARREHVVAMFDKAVEGLGADAEIRQIAALIMLDDLTRLYPDLASPTLDLIGEFLMPVIDKNHPEPFGKVHKKAFDIYIREAIREAEDSR